MADAQKRVDELCRLPDYADPLPAAVSLIVSNGAIERGMDGSTLARRLLPREVARAVLARTLPFRDAAALIFDRDAEGQLVYETMDWDPPARRGYWARNQTRIARSEPLEDALVTSLPPIAQL